MAAVSPAPAGTMAVADIVVGTRHRKDLGDVDGLAAVDLDDIVGGELAENAIRKDFLPSEIEAIRRAFSARVATPEGRPKTSENFGSFDRGKTTSARRA
jgi:hypothetical protein